MNGTAGVVFRTYKGIVVLKGEWGLGDWKHDEGEGEGEGECECEGFGVSILGVGGYFGVSEGLLAVLFDKYFRLVFWE